MTGGAQAQHLKALTSLRFFAAGAIFLFHLLQSVKIQLPALALGVCFFFVLSGFILAYVYGQFERATIRQFYWARFARLWPVHALTFTAAAAILYAGLITRPDGAAIAVVNVALLQTWVPLAGIPFSYNGVSWSISAEMAFYAVFPLLVFSRRFGVLYAGLAIATLVYLIGVDLLAPAKQTQRLGFDPLHLILTFPPARLLEFATGVALGRWYLRNPDPPAILARYPTMSESALLLAILSFGATAALAQGHIKGMGLPLTSLWYSQAGGFLIFAAAIAAFAYGRGALSRALSTPALVLLGEISFATYMVHTIVIKTFKLHASDWATGPRVLAVTVCTYALSYLVWRFWELPCRSLLRNSTVVTRPGSAAAHRSSHPAAQPSAPVRVRSWSADGVPP